MPALHIKFNEPRMTHWYWALIDEMLAHPTVAKREMALRFNVSVAHIYSITSSDTFKAAYAQRRAEFSAKRDEALINGLNIVGQKSLKYLAAVLDKK